MKLYELYHYGMPQRSGRYPYGSGERPYQSSEPAKKPSFRERRQEKKIIKRRTEALEKARKAAAEKRQRETAEAERIKKLEADKERVLRAGSASEVLKYQGLLTNQELQGALSRIKWTNELQAISAKEVKSGFDKIDDVMTKIGKVNTWATTGINVAENINKVMSAIDKSMKAADSEAAKKQTDTRKRLVKENTTRSNILRNADVLTGAEISDLKKKVDLLEELRKERAKKGG